jgi:hypothetical protein
VKTEKKNGIELAKAGKKYIHKFFPNAGQLATSFFGNFHWDVSII